MSQKTSKTPVKKKVPRYDWSALKLEFFKGSWLTVADFRRAKGFPGDKENPYMSKQMKGWALEKKEWMQGMVKRATNEIAEEQIEDIKTVRARQARLARWMYLKGAEKLKDLDPEDADQARRLIETGMKQEREALGVGKKGGGQNLTQINVNLPETQIDEMLKGASYVEILKFIAEVKRRRIAASGEPTIIEGTGEIEPGTTG